MGAESDRKCLNKVPWLLILTGVSVVFEADHND